MINQQKPKTKTIAIITALVGTVTPLAGIHKFYLGQPLWGVIYLLLWSTPIGRIASAIDVVLYFLQPQEEFEVKYNNRTLNKTLSSVEVESISNGIRELEKLRQDGLISEYEFEQKRRLLVERLG